LKLRDGGGILVKHVWFHRRKAMRVLRMRVHEVVVHKLVRGLILMGREDLLSSFIVSLRSSDFRFLYSLVRTFDLFIL